VTSKLTPYRVTWEIEVDAKSPEDAALLARNIQLDPESAATHFIVRRTVSQVSGRGIVEHETTEMWTIDLWIEPPQEEESE
jgi:hypothetical protein